MLRVIMDKITVFYWDVFIAKDRILQTKHYNKINDFYCSVCRSFFTNNLVILERQLQDPLYQPINMFNFTTLRL